MLFNSFEFLLLFFPSVFLIFRFLVKRNYSIAVCSLVISSLLFYGWWNPKYLFLIVGSITVNFFIGRVVQNQKTVLRRRKSFLVIGVLLNLMFLGYYKYFNFFITNMNFIFDMRFEVAQIVLPLAISFFTFQQITYLVDSYKNDIEEHNFLYYCLYVTFFPQLIAGPIVHHKEVLPQFIHKKPSIFSFDDIANGLVVFIVGLAKKVILADSLSVYSNPIFNASNNEVLTIGEAWIGALSYSLQLYFDFSGYSDMAIGIALMFGIVLPLNFNAPYKAKNIIEFWRCWHITLSRFLRDYLYIPLGGNKRGKVKRYRNLMITMVLGGIWHGAGWTFIVWGVLHGFYLCVNHLWHFVKENMGLSGKTTPLTKFVARISTFFFVTIGWVFFRSTSIKGAFSMVRSMVGLNGLSWSESPLFGNKALLLLFVSLIIVWGCPTIYEYIRVSKLHYKGTDKPIGYSLVKVAVAAAITIISLLFILTIQKPEFLYYDF